MQMRASALRAFLRRGLLNYDLAALLAVPRRYAVAPPELARDAPVAYVLHPLIVDVRPLLGDELYLSGLHRGDARVSKRARADEPLLGEVRLHDGVAAVAVSDGVAEVLDGEQRALFFKVGGDDVARGEAVHSGVLAGVLVHYAASVDDLYLFKVVALADKEVVRVVRRRNFDAA